jgi:NAD-dependent deacetylase
MNDVTPLEIAKFRGIVFLTGAGISAASGLRTYRGPDGMWNDPEMARLNDAAAFEENPAAVWRLFGQMRRAALEAQPNAAHLAIASCEARLQPGATLTVLTQNIDGLHQRAGSSNVVELHGSAFRTRCSSCDAPPFSDEDAHADIIPICATCDGRLRPDVILFGEPMPARAEWDAKRALRECDLFIAVGTSGRSRRRRASSGGRSTSGRARSW